MPKKSTSVLEKVSTLMKIPIFIHRLKKPPPNYLNLILYIKSRKIRKNFKLRRHYNCEFVHEYEFSASSTPLIGYLPTQDKERKAKNRDLCSILYVFTCFGIGSDAPPSFHCPIEGLVCGELEDATMLNRKEEEEEVETMSNSSPSVDERAEKFIQMFYQQMRMQRLQSS